ncbi:uncharacterized protein B0I36DRAFT_69961 [Microdochium trichocladiopsis]|uniref:C6 transcription factor n=1 Tax=Microdochium trichocladiopsis TaxID=1682393 RepID=A0A9P8YGK4_9PEZI|nr:uncharacterized protein B0I36DRAFT_69961 [Microdochium trichocladiopsis]KAH7037710.1 hypothetical protein B0I36DRAFT_69961 [Microdochium trichocladiopsis]
MVTTRAGTKTLVANGATGGRSPWIHVPSRMLLLWFAISLPLVTWDTIYVLGRPWTMEGGAWHWPMYVPYKLYGEVDHVYGWKAFNAKVGFTGAQGALNAIETAMYLVYVYIYWTSAVPAASVAGGSAKVGAAAQADKTAVLVGKPAAVAVLVAFSAFVMTLSKTILYWLCEYFSGYDNIGHNALRDLIVLWIIPNGAWLVAPTYLIYVLGQEIVEGLTMASAEALPIKSD